MKTYLWCRNILLFALSIASLLDDDKPFSARPWLRRGVSIVGGAWDFGSGFVP